MAGEQSGRSKGFGTITFAKHDQAAQAIDEFNGADLDGRTIEVRWDRGQTAKKESTPAPKKAHVVSTHKKDYQDEPAAESNRLFVGNLAWAATRYAGKVY